MFIDKDGVKIPTGSYEHEGFKYSSNIFRLWDEEELSAIGIYKVNYPPIPEGKQVVEWEFVVNETNATAIPELIDTPKYIPHAVTKAQGKSALVIQGLLQDVVAYMDGLEEPERTLAFIAFDDTNEWQRDSLMLSKAAESLSLSEENLDDLFILAETINL